MHVSSLRPINFAADADKESPVKIIVPLKLIDAPSNTVLATETETLLNGKQLRAQRFNDKIVYTYLVASPKKPWWSFLKFW